MKTFRIILTGNVQGVGFRPFVKRCAVMSGVNGYVKNLGFGDVEIVVQGETKSIKKFKELFSKKEDIMYIEQEVWKEIKKKKIKGFEIRKSNRIGKIVSNIPQDIAMCDKCKKEIEEKGRFYRYAFNSCAYCGPRFSFLYSLPYDRKNIAMNKFEMCEKCKEDYNNLWNKRRYDAKGISCKFCGPKLWVVDNKGKKVSCKDPIKFVAKKIENGNIICVKGIGGFHIACLATNDYVVEKLRKRKGREQKPFAIMVLNIDKAKSIAFLTNKEIDVLKSIEAPILIVKSKGKVSDVVAPGLKSIGIMLAYTPLHYLLLKEIEDGFAIMTSANKSGLNTIVSNKCAIKELHDIVDYFLLHNRNIVNRVDDSVVRISNKKICILRYGRGFVGRIIKTDLGSDPIIAVGSDINNTACVHKNGISITTQYNGDMNIFENIKDMEKSFMFLLKTYRIKIDKCSIVCDMNPVYKTRIYAEHLSEKYVKNPLFVQHHFAHISSVMGENNIKEFAVGIAIDGTGYGDDGNVWGSEIIVFDNNFKRVGGFESIDIVGGDRSVKYPARMTVSLMKSAGYSIEDIMNVVNTDDVPGGEREIDIVFNRNDIKCSSMGRFLDAISYYLGVCKKMNYEGEPAIKLEEFSWNGNCLKMHGDFIKRNKVMISDIFRYVHENFSKNKAYDIAYTVQYNVAKLLTEIATDFMDKGEYLLVSGGCASNRVIRKGIEDVASEMHLKVLYNTKIPCNDNNISFGQVYYKLLVSE